jgi:stage III sporulation protein SpoIIIAA
MTQMMKNNMQEAPPKTEYHEGYIEFLDEVCKPNKLGIDELRQYNEYRDVTDEECEKIIEVLYTLSLIAYYSLKQENQI